MKDTEYSVENIMDLMNAFGKNKLGSLQIVQDTFCLKLESRQVEQVATAIPATAANADIVEVSFAKDATEPRGNIVKSPIVGTFYVAPAPEKPPYATVGQKIKKGDVLFIIESMKLMNEVTSDFDGVVTEILVQNGTAVEYGQPIMAIE